MKLTELEEAMDRLDHEPARPRYTPKVNIRKPRRTKYFGWSMECIFVKPEVWRSMAGENEKGYFGGHGSKRLWIVWYQGEEMGKFTTKLKAQAYIWSKVDG
jgi:hypothetical protein